MRKPASVVPVWLLMKANLFCPLAVAKATTSDQPWGRCWRISTIAATAPPR